MFGEKRCFLSTLRCQCTKEQARKPHRGSLTAEPAPASSQQRNRRCSWETGCVGGGGGAPATATADLVARPRLPMSSTARVTKEGQRRRAERRTVSIHCTQRGRPPKLPAATAAEPRVARRSFIRRRLANTLSNGDVTTLTELRMRTGRLEALL